MRFFAQAKATQFSLPLRRPFFFLSAALFLILSVQGSYLLLGLADSSSETDQNGEGRVGCPHCKNDGSELSRLLQEADALYASFKPKEALKELLKVLSLDPQNYEALAKVSRVYIDFGDMMLESGPDGQEKRLSSTSSPRSTPARRLRPIPKGHGVTSTWPSPWVK